MNMFMSPDYSGLLMAQNAWALLVLRLVFAVIFIAHGFPKLKNLQNTWSNFESMGFKPGKLWGTIVAVLEAVGSVLILIGISVQLIAFLLAIQMIVVVFWRIKSGHKFVNGYELDLLLVAAALVLATMGGGPFSLGIYF